MSGTASLSREASPGNGGTDRICVMGWAEAELWAAVSAEKFAVIRKRLRRRTGAGLQQLQTWGFTARRGWTPAYRHGGSGRTSIRYLPCSRTSRATSLWNSLENRVQASPRSSLAGQLRPASRRRTAPQSIPVTSWQHRVKPSTALAVLCLAVKNHISTSPDIRAAPSPARVRLRWLRSVALPTRSRSQTPYSWCYRQSEGAPRRNEPVLSGVDRGFMHDGEGRRLASQPATVLFNLGVTTSKHGWRKPDATDADLHRHPCCAAAQPARWRVSDVTARAGTERGDAPLQSKLAGVA